MSKKEFFNSELLELQQPVQIVSIGGRLSGKQHFISEKFQRLEELGIDLIVLLKALRDGIYYKLNLGQAEKVDGVSLNYCVSTGYFIHFEYLNYDICLDTKDYGKTWALTKEEL